MKGVFAIAPPKTGRVTWAAWWTSRPTKTSFSGPDAHGVAVDEHAARGAAFAAFAQVRGCRQWSEIAPVFAVAAERWAKGRELPWAKKDKKPTAPTSIGEVEGIDLALLGLRWPVTMAEAREAYRSKALEHHPDRGGSHDEMLAINAVWVKLKKALGEE